MKDILIHKDYSTGQLVFKDIDGKKGIVTGYFSHFGNVDSDGDIIKSGAFTKTIRENGPNSARPRIKHLLNHDPSKPLGVLTELKEDATGLYYESKIGTHTLGSDFVKMAESGLISEHSIGFRTIKFNQIQDYEGYRSSPEKGWRELTEIKLYEGSSLTAWGANELTPLTGMKSAEYIDQLVKKSEAVEKFCRNSDASDETIEALLLFNKQLTQALIEVNKSDKEAIEPAAAIQPDELKDVVKTFLNKLKSH